MKLRRNISSLLVLAALALLCSCCGKKPQPDTPGTFSPLVKGADISWVTELEDQDFKFYNAAGQERELTALMKEIGFNAIRLRVWVDPIGVYNNVGDVVEKATRAQALGLKVMVDFHYSSSWADPGQQSVPLSWKDKDPDGIVSAIELHTSEILGMLQSRHVDVAWVQIGNEVTNGMLWESGRVADTSVGEFVRYFHAGREAAKSMYPQAQVILHLDNGWNLGTLNWFLSLMKGASLQYDMLGLSLYPSYWEHGAYPDWKPKVQQFVENLPVLNQNYGKPIMLVEFGMPASQPAKAKAALQYLLDNTKDYSFFNGIFYWEPEAEHDRNGYDYGAFSGGKPTAALEPFAQ